MIGQWRRVAVGLRKAGWDGDRAVLPSLPFWQARYCVCGIGRWDFPCNTEEPQCSRQHSVERSGCMTEKQIQFARHEWSKVHHRSFERHHRHRAEKIRALVGRGNQGGSRVYFCRILRDPWWRRNHLQERQTKLPAGRGLFRFSRRNVFGGRE